MQIPWVIQHLVWTLSQFFNRLHGVFVWDEHQALGRFDRHRLGNNWPGVAESCCFLNALIEAGDGADLAAQAHFADAGSRGGRCIRTHSESLPRGGEGGSASRLGTDGERVRYGRAVLRVARGPRAFHPSGMAQTSSG